MKRFRAWMDADNPNWELVAFFGRVNQYYFTGTMQDGVLLVPRDREGVFWVRRSFERACAEMRRAGAIHRRVLEEGVPALLREEMSEAEFACDLYSLLVREGHQGIIRFGRFNVDIAVGQLGFGENSIYPTSFDGPGGCLGSPATIPALSCFAGVGPDLDFGRLRGLSIDFFIIPAATFRVAVRLLGPGS